MTPVVELPLPRCACTAVLPLFLLCAALPAQEKPDEGKALVARIDAARGKLPAALAIEGTFAITFEGQPDARVGGTFRHSYAGADNARHTSSMGEWGDMERGLTKDLTWELDPGMGGKVHRGAQAVVTRRYFALLRGASATQLYREIARTGTEQVDGREHVVLRMTPAQGKPDTWYVDAETATVSRIAIMLPAPESAALTWGMDDWIAAQIGFADWKKVDGSLQPGRHTMKMGPATVTYTCTKFDAAFKPDAEAFTPPAAILALKNQPEVKEFDDTGKPLHHVVEREAQPVASVRVKCKPAEISATLATILPEVGAYLTSIGAKMTGPPFSRYHAVSDTEVDIEGGMPVAKPVPGKGRVVAGELPAGKCARVWHIGPYEKLRESHLALSAWVTQQKGKQRGAPWEVYWTDPGMVPDPAKWRTQLFLPID